MLAMSCWFWEQGIAFVRGSGSDSKSIGRRWVSWMWGDEGGRHSLPGAVPLTQSFRRGLRNQWWLCPASQQQHEETRLYRSCRPCQVQDSTRAWKRSKSGVFWHADLLLWIYQEVPGGWAHPTEDGFWHKSGDAPAQKRERGIEEGGKHQLFWGFLGAHLRGCKQRKLTSLPAPRGVCRTPECHVLRIQTSLSRTTHVLSVISILKMFN